MNASLVINGWALYVFFGFMLVLIVGFIFYGMAYVYEARKNDKFSRELKRERKAYSKLKEKYYKETFKVPDMEKENV